MMNSHIAIFFAGTEKAGYSIKLTGQALAFASLYPALSAHRCLLDHAC